MAGIIDLRVLELLAARLCHDLIGPISAVSNGAELLAEEEPEFIRDAVALVGDSAKKASRRLQFYRFALGFSGGALTGSPPHQLVAEFFENGSIRCDYREAARALPLDRQKLGCAMLAVAAEALPRGGAIVLDVGANGLEVAASGDGIGPSLELRAALGLTVPTAELTSRTVAGYITALLAQNLGWRLIVTDAAGGFRLATA